MMFLSHVLNVFGLVFCLHFSIGSLGAGNSEAEVSNIRVDRALISGTSNGVRIKTWQVREAYHLYRRQLFGFKTYLLGRGFHILIRNAWFLSPTDVGSHNLPPSTLFGV